jgi:hypothetical protein
MPCLTWSEWPEDRQDRERVEDLALCRLGRRTVDDDDVAGIDFRVRRLAAADAGEVERRGLPLPADLAEDRDAPRIAVLRDAAGRRDRLDEGRRPIDRIGAGLADRPVDSDVAPGGGLDADADVRVLEIFLAKLRRQPLVELRGGQLDGRDFADQGHRDLAGEVDLIVAGQVRHLEDLDTERIERGDAVVLLERHHLGCIRGAEGGDIVGNGRRVECCPSS